MRAISSKTSSVSAVNIDVDFTPVASNDSGAAFTLNEDSSISTGTPGVLGNDTDGDTPLASLSAVLVGGSPANAASFSLNANGSFSYQPNPDFSGTDTFTYKVTDGVNESNIATVFITVNPLNDAPVLVNAIPNQNGTDNAPFTFQFAPTTFSDVDGDTLMYTATKADDSALPTWLNFNAATRTFSGTPSPADAGTLSIKVTASDGTLTAVDTFDLVIADTTAPTVNVTSSATNLKAGDTATIQFVFSEPVSDFTLADIDFGTNAAIVVPGSLTGSSTTYSVVVTAATSVSGLSTTVNVLAGSYLDASGNLGGVDLTAPPTLFVDTVAPTVNTISVGTFGASRSRVTSMTVNFAENVVISDIAGAFVVRTRTTHLPVAIDLTLSSVSGSTATIVFDNSTSLVDASGSLLDGNYELVVDPTKIADSTGNLLGGGSSGPFAGGDGGNFVFGDQSSDNFYRLYGDINTSRSVTFADYSVFIGLFGITMSSPSYRADLDFNDNGSITFADYSEFISRFGLNLGF